MAEVRIPEMNGQISEMNARPQETLSELMGMANCIGKDALNMAMIINNHLFGDGRGIAGDTEPKCYREVMQEHCDTLRHLCGELQKTIDLLGCRQ